MRDDFKDIEEILDKYKRATNQPVQSKKVVKENNNRAEEARRRANQREKNKSRVRRVGAGVLAALSLGATIYFADKAFNNKKTTETKNQETVVSTTQATKQTETVANFAQTTLQETTAKQTTTQKHELIDEIADHVSLKHFSGKASDPDGNYYCLDEDYALALSKQAIENVYERIKKANPSSELLNLLDAGIIDEYLLTSISFVESNYRFQNSDHSLFANSTGVAFGMTQAQIPTLETINNRFSKYGANFEKEDLANPQNALEFSAYDLLFNLAYFGTKALDYQDENNIDALRTYCAASYYHGCNGALKMLQDDTIYNSSYANKVMNKYGSLLEQYADFEK